MITKLYQRNYGYMFPTCASYVTPFEYNCMFYVCLYTLALFFFKGTPSDKNKGKTILSIDIVDKKK